MNNDYAEQASRLQLVTERTTVVSDLAAPYDRFYGFAKGGLGDPGGERYICGRENDRFGRLRWFASDSQAG